MTTEQIRIAVAREMGWHHITPTLLSGKPLHGMGNFDAQEIPNYPTSLDACAEFEKTLTEGEREIYLGCLYDFTNDGLNDYDGETIWGTVFEFVTMTAPQRCKAYLRMKGKWEEAS